MHGPMNVKFDHANFLFHKQMHTHLQVHCYLCPIQLPVYYTSCILC